MTSRTIKTLPALVFVAILACHAWTVFAFPAIIDVAAKQQSRKGRVQLWEGGPYWATTNIGAEEPWECGLYFWWGDSIGYRREGDAWVASDGSMRNYSFKYEKMPTFDKSATTLQNEGWITSAGVLAPEHDAAEMQWGGGWRMPTLQEFSALNGNCDWTWTTMNGVCGYVVRGRGDFTSNYIFLPAAGIGQGTSLLNGGGMCGDYWSSVPYPVISGYSWILGFDSDCHAMYYYDRHNGRPIRPVQGFDE